MSKADKSFILFYFFGNKGSEEILYNVYMEYTWRQKKNKGIFLSFIMHIYVDKSCLFTFFGKAYIPYVSCFSGVLALICYHSYTHIFLHSITQKRIKCFDELNSAHEFFKLFAYSISKDSRKYLFSLNLLFLHTYLLLSYE